MKALIVDSSRMYRSLLKEFLYGFSIVPEEAETGEEALVRLNEGGFELVCITMHLADMLGTELAKKIKELPKCNNIFILLLSSDREPNKIAKMQTADVNAVCQKMALDELKSLLSKVSKNQIILCKCSGHLLYVEDHLTLANMTTEILQQMGLTVDHVTTAELALSAFEKNNYDLILLDIILPGKKNGIAIIEEIRSRDDDKRLFLFLLYRHYSTHNSAFMH